MSGRPAVFLDRDGTIIQERHYLADPDGVTLVPGAVDALRAFAAAGYRLVIVTNQSGIARGLYTDVQFRAVQQRLERVLEQNGVRLDGVYHCPHHPDFSGPCDCRKPDLGMYWRAAEEIGLDLATSLYIGDRIRDVLPAVRLGGRGYLVQSGYGVEEAAGVPAGVAVATDLLDVARRERIVGVDTARNST